MTTTTAPGGTATVAATRLDGVDVARALAILGMVTVHIGPYPVDEGGPAAWVYASFAGKASLLFVVVAGIGVALLSGRHDRRTVRARLLYRTAWLLPLGLWLQSLDHPVAVILQYYAVYFALVAPFVGRGGPVLRRWALVLAAFGSVLVLATYVLTPEWVVPLQGDSPTGVLGDIALFGYYPAVTWVPAMVFGMYLGTLDLATRRTQVWLMAGGAASLLVTTQLGRVLPDVLGVQVGQDRWTWLLTTEAHSQMPLWLIGGVGFAVGVLGASLLVAARWPRLLRPLADLGRLALSVYVGHLLLFHVTDTLLVARDVTEGIGKVLVFGVVVTVASTLWLRRLPRGPLEAVVRAGWQRIRSRVAPHP
ncbi:MAG TPA: DUF418 domain-containing protein [Nitriliruptorales bacterium]